jgi:hypothetical protein
MPRVFLPAKYPLDLSKPEFRQHEERGDGNGGLPFLLSAVQRVRGQCIREESRPLAGTPHLDQLGGQTDAFHHRAALLG